MHHVVAVGPLGDEPVQMSCPQCHQLVLSKLDHSAGLLTYLSCAGLFFCGYEGHFTSHFFFFTFLTLLMQKTVVFLCSFVLGCCLVPFCVDRLRDVKHTCPACKTQLGVYKRL